MFVTQSKTPVSLPKLQIIEPVQEISEIPAQGPLQSSFHGPGQSQTFLTIGKTISFPSCSLLLFESSCSMIELGQVGIISSLNIIDMVKFPPKLPSSLYSPVINYAVLVFASLSNYFSSPQTVGCQPCDKRSGCPHSLGRQTEGGSVTIHGKIFNNYQVLSASSDGVSFNVKE